MAGAWVQTIDKQTASGTSLAIAITTTAGNHLAIATGCGNNVAGSAPTVSNGGSVQGAIADVGDGSGGGAAHLREDYQENVAGGATTVTVKAAGATEITGIVRESSGVAASASLGAVSHLGAATNGTTIQAGSITPAAGSVVYASTADASGATSADTIDSSFTVDSDSTAWNGANQRAGSAHLNGASGGALNPTWTLPTGTSRVAMIVEYKQATGGGTTYSKSVSVSSASAVVVSRAGSSYLRSVSAGTASALAVSRVVSGARTIAASIASVVGVARAVTSARPVTSSIGAAAVISRAGSAYPRSVALEIGPSVVISYAGQQAAQVFTRMTTMIGF